MTISHSAERSWALRARIMSPRDDGSRLMEDDGIIEVLEGVINWVGPARDYRGSLSVEDLRPLVIMPGLIDLHVHLPQFPITASGSPADLHEWLERRMIPVERAYTAEKAAAVAGSYFRAFAGVGTTTALIFGAADAESTQESFRAAADHGLRVVMGQVLMDRMRYDNLPEAGITDRRLSEAEATCLEWNGFDDGRIRYAFTPRYAPATSREMLEGSAALARQHNAYWQTHLAEDVEDLSRTAADFPEASDYVDVYDRAGGLSKRSVFAHAVHLTDSELDRLRISGSSIAHCPSNVFGVGGLMDLGAYLEKGLTVGIGSDVGGASQLSLFSVMQIGWLCQRARARMLGGPVVDDVWSWFELATLGGARSLGQEDRIGSLEVGKDFDGILIDAESLLLVPDEDMPLERVLHLAVFRTHPGMVQRTWVRGRELARVSEMAQ